MRRCRGPLDQMKAIVGLALWCLSNAYLLIWVKVLRSSQHVFHLRAVLQQKLVLNREKRYCTIEIDFLMSQFSEMSCLWNIMSFVPVSICCRMKKEGQTLIKNASAIWAGVTAVRGNLLFYTQCRTTLHNAAIKIAGVETLKEQFFRTSWSYFPYKPVMRHSNGIYCIFAKPLLIWIGMSRILKLDAMKIEKLKYP